MIKVVLFDYGGVLTAGGGVGSMTRLVANAMGVSWDDAVRARPLLGQLLLGNISTDEFLQKLAEMYPASPRPTRETLITSADIYKRSPEVYDLASKLRKRGFRTAILSNMLTVSAEELRKQGFYDDFDPVILSCEEHLAKPAEAFYQRALEKLQVAAQEVLFIDDQDRYLAGARKVGMHTILAESPEQIVAEIRRIIKEQNALDIG